MIGYIYAYIFKSVCAFVCIMYIHITNKILSVNTFTLNFHDITTILLSWNNMVYLTRVG